MGWETRQGLGRYYTRSFRVNGRVVREYVGAGLAGELAALEDEKEREQRQLERERQRKERERLESIETELGTLAALSNMSLKETLESAGYHCHKGQWRKQRSGEVKAVSEEQQLVPQQPTVDSEGIRQILEAVRERRPGSLEAFDNLIKEIPELVTLADMTRLAEESLLHLTAGEDALDFEMRRAWLEETRRRLTEPGDGELERQLIHRLSLNLLAVSDAESRRARRWRASPSWSEVDSWDRHISRLQSDLLKSFRALVEVRRLAQPTVLAQMNIADKQQINIAGAPQPIGAAGAE